MASEVHENNVTTNVNTDLLNCGCKRPSTNRTLCYGLLTRFCQLTHYSFYTNTAYVPAILSTAVACSLAFKCNGEWRPASAGKVY